MNNALTRGRSFAGVAVGIGATVFFEVGGEIT